MKVAARKLMVFDCDSTLSAIEGIDELGAMRGPEVKAQIESLTQKAMAGEIAIEAIFGARMEIIRPTREECLVVGNRYIEQVEPHAKEVIHALKADGWEVLILSGGFLPVIEPLAAYLEVDTIEAVPLTFHEDGSYADYGQDYPTTRNGGKPEILARMKTELNPELIVMVGDGVSDLETQSIVDRFIGFGRYAVREKVKAGADHFIHSLDELAAAIGDL